MASASLSNGPTPLAAQEPADSAHRVDPFAGAHHPGSIHLDADRLAVLAAEDPFGLLALLSHQSGLTFRSTGDFGAEDWFLVRGFGRDNSRMTLILVDGVPANLSNNHTVEFDDIPLGEIRSLTLYPGPVPARFGGYQSVIEIETYRNRDLFRLHTQYGALSTVEAGLRAGRAGTVFGEVGFDLTATDGQSGEALEGILSDWVNEDRRFRSVRPSALLGYAPRETLEVTLRVNALHDLKHFAEGLLFGEDPARERRQLGTSVRVQSGAPGRGERTFVLHHREERETLNPVFPENPAYQVHWGDQRRSVMGARGRVEQPISSLLALSAGFEVQASRGRTTDPTVYFRYVDRQRFGGLYGEVALLPTSGTRILAGVRADRQEAVSGWALGPSVAVEQRIGQTGISLHGAWGRTHRWIPLNEVNTSQRPPRVLGPPFLAGAVAVASEPLAMEAFQGVDAGVRYRPMGTASRLAPSVRLHYFRLENRGTFGAPAFQIHPVEEGPSVPAGFEAALVALDRNFPGRDRSQGLEAEIETRLERPGGGRVDLVINATRFLLLETVADPGITLYTGPLGGPAAQEALNASVGAWVLPYAGNAVIPGGMGWLANAGATFETRGRHLFQASWQLRGETTGPLMKFGTDPQVETIPASQTLSIGAASTLPLGADWEARLSLRVFNLFETRYQTFVHYPMPGRFIQAGATLTRP